MATLKTQCARTGSERLFAAALGLALWINLGPIFLEGQNRSAPEVHPPVSEYDVKAAFLLNFAKFVEWPSSEDRRASGPFSICILGEDLVGTALDQLAAGETILNRRIVVKRVRKPGERCEVLFISNSVRDDAAVLRDVEPGVLTVGETPDFVREGGMIGFVVDGRKVRFDVNRGAAERASVQISSRLLSVARNVLR